MTLQQIRDSFVVKYKIECAKRRTAEVQLGDVVIAKLISDAETDIQRRQRVVENSTTQELTTDVYNYDLPKDFGEIKTVIYTDTNNEITPLERVDLQDLQEVSGDSGIPTQYSLILANGVPQIQFNLAETGYSVTIFYWANLNSEYTRITGSPKLPHIYTDAMVLHMLSQFFDDLTVKYEMNLRSLKETQYTNTYSLGYKINGGIG